MLPDFSGLAWADHHRFLAVHDAKNPDESQRPRVSLLWLPESGEGIAWKPVDLEWPPPLGLSSDLESVARIPGTQSFLLVESGEGYHNGRQYRRIFHVELVDQQFKIVSFTDLPAPVKNIEGAAVARFRERLTFVFAERAEGQSGTDIVWTDFRLHPLKLGLLQQVRFRPADSVGRNWRPVSAIETDSQGNLYVASAFDPGDDNGPFRSAIWRIGQLRQARNGKARVVLAGQPLRLAMLDGLKVESLAIRERADGGLELFAGTDDENYGGALRLIPFQP